MQEIYNQQQHSLLVSSADSSSKKVPSRDANKINQDINQAFRRANKAMEIELERSSNSLGLLRIQLVLII